jgi:hypothetical protein
MNDDLKNLVLLTVKLLISSQDRRGSKCIGSHFSISLISFGAGKVHEQAEAGIVIMNRGVGSQIR